MWPGFRARLSSREWNVSSKAFTCDVKLEWDSVQVSSLSSRRLTHCLALYRGTLIIAVLPF